MGKSSSQLSGRRRELKDSNDDNSDDSKRKRTAMEGEEGGQTAEQRRFPLSEVVADCINRWFQDTLKAARTGDINMQVLVGQMYYSGYGVPKDANKGKIWITRASRMRSSVWKVSNKRPDAFVIPFEGSLTNLRLPDLKWLVMILPLLINLMLGSGDVDSFVLNLFVALGSTPICSSVAWESLLKLLVLAIKFGCYCICGLMHGYSIDLCELTCDHIEQFLGKFYILESEYANLVAMLFLRWIIFSSRPT